MSCDDRVYAYALPVAHSTSASVIAGRADADRGLCLLLQIRTPALLYEVDRLRQRCDCDYDMSTDVCTAVQLVSRLQSSIVADPQHPDIMLLLLLPF